jgi:hypothetical protein
MHSTNRKLMVLINLFIHFSFLRFPFFEYSK